MGNRHQKKAKAETAPKAFCSIKIILIQDNSCFHKMSLVKEKEAE